ncbi:nitroreductase family deazaflavin-dependent oxidoreductase [Nocardia mangyaensis]|uniref:nitroreductase family deazaflavin-dependent oxidoreductase n=1 Tax=Nocardia mangyaensis TaxID=2213200 RepID=UPI002676B771|nr:nitroreductase family deazaflavin-dependent oxidoreductase [Nocardia mangyaensis]MDO3648645.1 nitroreductase family deazaflavin-dependent oxidoreductase [Nocardia mangyaensis]
MPMPRWWGRINKRVFNPRAVASGKWPVLTHVGRASGATYRTPLDAHPVEGGYLFVLVYGSGSDWVRNILTSGSARLRVEGHDMELTAPRVVGRDEAFEAMPADAPRPPKLLRINEFLRMDLAEARHTTNQRPRE